MSRSNSRKTNKDTNTNTNTNTKLHSYSYRTIIIVIIICIIIIKELISETKLISNITTEMMMTTTMTMATTAVHGNMQEISSQSSTNKTNTETNTLDLVENDDNDNEVNIHSYFLSSSLSMTNVDDLYERNFFYRAWNNSITVKVNSNNNDNGNKRILPKPMNVLIDYISQHSDQQLEKEWLECNSKQSHHTNNTSDIECPTLHQQRQYLVATYSCPIESGNRLHRYMNGLLWSVLTNRTFLWRYHTNEVCQEYNKNEDKNTKTNCDKEYNPNIIKGSHELDCLGLLHRSNWIPSYDKWKSRLRIDDVNIMKAEIYDGQKTYDTTTLPYDPYPYNDNNTNNDNDNNTNTNNFIIRTGKQVNLNPGSILTIELEQPILHNKPTPTPTTKHLIQPKNLERLSDLRSSYGYGNNDNNSSSSSSASGNNKNKKLSNIYFIYGMLFESMFTIDSSLDPSHDLLATAKQQHSNTTTNTNNTKSNTLVQSNNNRTIIETVFLHSRHAGHFANDYIWPEHLCLEKIFPKQQQIIAAINETNVTTTTTTNTTPIPLPLPILPPCHIYVMSDAPVTVKLLHKEIHDNTQCTSSSTSSMHKYNTNNNNNNNNITEIDEKETTTTGISFSAEHGPRAGRGYWEDLSLAIHARSGMIAFHMFHRKHNLIRTSTALIKEIIDFRRYLEYNNDIYNNDDNNDKKLQIPSFYECTNPWKDKKKKNKKRKGK